MSILVKAGTGLVAGVVAGVLGLAFMPQGAPIAVKPRLAVEKPQLVFANEATSPNVQTASAVVVQGKAAAPTPIAAPAPAPDAKSTELAKPAAQAQPAPGVSPSAAAKAAAPPTPIAVARLEPTAPAPAAKPASPAAVAETRAPAPPPTPAAPVSEAAARLSVPGLVALAKGDLSTARLFLMRAAEAGDARAWVALADTYDPAILTKLGVVGCPGDPQRARDYLGKAVAAGIVVAKDRMAALEQISGSVR